MRKLELDARQKSRARRTRYVWVSDWDNMPEEAKAKDGEQVICYGWAKGDEDVAV